MLNGRAKAAERYPVALRRAIYRGLIKHRLNKEHKLQYNYLALGNNEIISQNQVVRDLGLLVNPEGNYNDHISKVYSKISHRAGLMLRTFEDSSVTHMKFIWKVYLKPLIDYCSQLYSPDRNHC